MQISTRYYVPSASEKQIATLKQNLSDTDYKAIKFAEGLLTAEEYEPIKQQRQAWRTEINALSAPPEVITPVE